ncbi:glycosyltransferase family 4 protein [Clostridium botulinum]|nr:glycosyltransferase family 4 protein [Clostridium botulinum]NFO54522.1 glycosyltransferase family 4 protein [Clostridium botulinum]
MKIVFFIGGLGGGGAERVVCNLSDYLSKKNDVTILTLSSIKSIYKINQKVTHINLENDKKIKLFLLKNTYRIYNLYKFIKIKEYDIIITFLPIPSFIMLLFRSIIKAPILVSVRNDPKIEYKSKYMNLIMKWLYPRADGFVFQTEEAKNYFKNIINNNYDIIPNPINKEFLIDPFCGEREKVIVSVGRLVAQKNHILLINAFSEICNKYPEYKLIIYGDGELRDKLEQRIEELNLNNRVILPGNVENVPKHIYKASLFILSSDYEGMPNALMEAMALGLPVISTDCPCGGPNFLIKHGINGILIPVGNSKELVSAIDIVLTDKDYLNKLSKESSKICENLSPERIFLKWQKYIYKFCTKI